MADEEVPDFYDLLEVSEDASERELQKAFRKQAIKYHPDKNPSKDAAKKFHLLSVALDLLTTVERRLVYDTARRQKHEARIRKEKIDGERKVWIEELERSEQAAAQNKSSAPAKRKWQAESKEEELAAQGARLRAELMQSRRTPQGTTSESHHADTRHAPEKLASQCAPIERRELNTVIVRWRGRSLTTQELSSMFGAPDSGVEVIYKPNTNKIQTALLSFPSASLARIAARTAKDAIHLNGVDFTQIKLMTEDRSSTTEAVQASQNGQIPETQRQSIHKTAALDANYQSSVLARMKQRQKEKVSMAK